MTDVSLRDFYITRINAICNDSNSDTIALNLEKYYKTIPDGEKRIFKEIILKRAFWYYKDNYEARYG